RRAFTQRVGPKHRLRNTPGAGPFGTFGCHDGWAGTVSALAPDGFEAGVSAFDDHVVPTFGRERP
ncbi:hypothetical protein ACF057_33355, partial [Rhodococcus erythropolis]